ncbi:E3 ubiquitin-protein ligase MIB1 [Trichoplax sp. H2]|nr:E3 ubiquitin-protein ligase MIB1 [Trichoplax sp. H2]|eukprot:RDD46134.1 E3 ubiquitin-protein ligase MIB1 [Trichoplax sp. H2]
MSNLSSTRGLLPCIGARVIRGPDWKWGKQDGGEGHVGTVRSMEGSDAFVVWDNGTAANYRCCDAYDLRTFDDSATGIEHTGSMCEGCRMMPIYGTRWKCVECPSCDLCTLCYNSDKHNLRHRFYRIRIPNAQPYKMESRRKSKKISVRGIFPGARVVRGYDWSWEDQDGGPGCRGKVVEISDWTSASPRSAVYVQWENSNKNLYRLGFSGMSDLKALTDTKGGAIYRDHMPFIQSHPELPSLLDAAAVSFTPGDYVTINLEQEVIRSLQQGHGGWIDQMHECLNSIGKVLDIDRDQDIVVVYANGNRWTFNPHVLTKLSRETAAPRFNASSSHLHSEHSSNPDTNRSTICVGDVVRLNPDVDQVRVMQTSHGGWCDSMIASLGKVGRVTHIYENGDIKVEVDNQIWTLNPGVITKLQPRQCNPEFAVNQADRFSEICRQVIMSNLTSDQMVSIVSEAGLRLDGQNFDDSSRDLTQLSVIEFLIKAGANLELEDEHGDRIAHCAGIRNRNDVIRLISRYDVDLNTRNSSGQTPLHLAVLKKNAHAIEALLECGCHISLQDVDGNSPLHLALIKNNESIINALLQGKADMSVTNNEGFNAIHLATKLGNVSNIQALIRKMPHSWYVNIKKDDGYSALHIAVLNSYIEVADLLIQQGHADINSCNAINGETPLHIAIDKANVKMIELLLERDADINLQDMIGNTPLHKIIRTLTQILAREKQSGTYEKIAKTSALSIISMLLSKGANINIKDNEGSTPYDLCDHFTLYLIKLHCQNEEEQSSSNHGEATNKDTKCAICSTAVRNSIFLPCQHSLVCWPCAGRMKKCLKCKRSIETFEKLETCRICHKKVSETIFKPCGHISTCKDCGSMQRKCPVCRLRIDDRILLNADLDSEAARAVSPVNEPSPTKRSSIHEVENLKQELKELKEKTLCPVCMDRKKNLVFLCGHGICQMCGDRLVECPICRRSIEKKIVLF